MKNPFTTEELERIKQAVTEAEQRTSGEIVPYIVDRSGEYDVAIWRAASIAAVLALAVSVFIQQFYDGWRLAWVYTGWGTALLALVAGMAGAVCAQLIPGLQRRLAGSALLDRTVHQRALQEFVEEEIFNTRDRTGILIFISLFEHRIEVIGDTGINRLVSADDWADVVLRIRDGIKSGHLAEGIIEAIHMCGHLLERSGVAVRHDDIDELQNELRVKRGR